MQVIETKLLNDLKKELIKVFPLSLNIKKQYRSVCIEFFPFGFPEKASEFFIYFTSYPDPISIRLVCESLQYVETFTKKGDLSDLALKIRESFISMLREFSERVSAETKKLEDNFNGIKTNDVADNYMLARHFSMGMSASDFNAKIKVLGGDASNYEISKTIYTNIKESETLLYSFITSRAFNEDVKRQAKEFSLKRWIKLKNNQKYFWWAMKYAFKVDKTLIPETINILNESNIKNLIKDISFSNVKEINSIEDISDFYVVKKKFPNLERVNSLRIRPNNNACNLIHQIASTNTKVNKVQIYVRYYDNIDEAIYQELFEAGVLAKLNNINIQYSAHSKDARNKIEEIERKLKSIKIP